MIRLAAVSGAWPPSLLGLDRHGRRRRCAAFDGTIAAADWAAYRDRFVMAGRAGGRRRQRRHQPQRGPGLRPAPRVLGRRPRRLRAHLRLHPQPAPHPRRRPRGLEVGPEGQSPHRRRQQCQRRRHPDRLRPRPRRQGLGRAALHARRRPKLANAIGTQSPHRGERPRRAQARRRRASRRPTGRTGTIVVNPSYWVFEAFPVLKELAPQLRLGRARLLRRRDRRRGPLRQRRAARRLGDDHRQGPRAGRGIPGGLRLQRHPHPALPAPRRNRRRLPRSLRQPAQPWRPGRGRAHHRQEHRPAHRSRLPDDRRAGRLQPRRRRCRTISSISRRPPTTPRRSIFSASPTSRRGGGNAPDPCRPLVLVACVAGAVGWFAGRFGWSAGRCGRRRVDADRHRARPTSRRRTPVRRVAAPDHGSSSRQSAGAPPTAPPTDLTAAGGAEPAAAPAPVRTSPRHGRSGGRRIGAPLLRAHRATSAGSTPRSRASSALYPDWMPPADPAAPGDLRRSRTRRVLAALLRREIRRGAERHRRAPGARARLGAAGRADRAARPGRRPRPADQRLERQAVEDGDRHRRRRRRACSPAPMSTCCGGSPRPSPTPTGCRAPWTPTSTS